MITDAAREFLINDCRCRRLFTTDRLSEIGGGEFSDDAHMPRLQKWHHLRYTMLRGI